MPLPKRWLTSCMFRFNGSSLLIDAGEGTQIAMRELGWSPKPIDTILLTHFHADHIAGLPGLLLLMGNADRTEPLTIIGPKGTGRMLSAVRTIAPELPFETRAVEIEGNEQHFSRNGFEITAFRVQHSILCYSYKIEIRRGGKFDVERAKAAGVPLKLWNPLQKGQTVEYEGRTFTPDMVIGPERRGIKVVYSTDTRPVPQIAEQADHADLLIAEAIYGDNEDIRKAKSYRHMTMPESAELARRAQVKELWFTHYSPSFLHPEHYIDAARDIFPNAVATRDGRNISIPFDDE